MPTTTGTAARWEHFAHGADAGVRGFGATKAEAFAQAARALTAVVTDPSGVRPREALSIRCRAADDELLLVAWLNAVIAEMSARRMLFSRFEPRLEGGALRAVIAGEPADAARHAPAVEPKGATLTALRVARERGVWMAQCVVDV
jgi:SHS2 domain-containing protein